MPDFIGWGKEYAAFSLRHDDVKGVTQYIMNQKEHHKYKAFKDEYKHLIESEGITIKQEYFLVD